MGVGVGITIERQEFGALGDAVGVQIFDGIVHTIRSVSDHVRNAGRLKLNPPAVRLDLLFFGRRLHRRGRDNRLWLSLRAGLF